MGELEAVVGRYFRFIFTKVLSKWWESLDESSKSNWEVGFAVVFGVGSLVFVWTALNTLQSDRRMMAKGFRTMAYKWGQALGEKIFSIKKQISPFWRVLEEVRVGALVCGTFLMLAAFGSWPHNLYVLTRIVVCVSFAWSAFLLHGLGRSAWVAACAFWAVLFNPVASFRFDKDTWQVFNLLALATLVVVVYVYAHLQLKIRQVVSQPPASGSQDYAEIRRSATITKSGGYRYCTGCEVRVGRVDERCKSCGATLM